MSRQAANHTRVTMLNMPLEFVCLRKETDTNANVTKTTSGTEKPVSTHVTNTHVKILTTLPELAPQDLQTLMYAAVRKAGTGGGHSRVAQHKSTQSVQSVLLSELTLPPIITFRRSEKNLRENWKE